MNINNWLFKKISGQILENVFIQKAFFQLYNIEFE